MSKDCVAALIKQAAAVDVEGLSAKDACDKVKDELLETMDPDCYSWVRERDWNNITSVRKYLNVTYIHTYLGANNLTSFVRARRAQAYLTPGKLYVQLLASLPQGLQSHKGRIIRGGSKRGPYFRLATRSHLLIYLTGRRCVQCGSYPVRLLPRRLRHHPRARKPDELHQECGEPRYGV